MLTYRPADLDDMDQVLALMGELYAHEKIELSDSVRAATEMLLRNPVAGRIFFIQSEGQVVGYAVLTTLFSLEFGGPCGFLDELYISPEYRGQGFGRQALTYFMDSAEKEGLVAIRLEVARTNDAALKLYESAGFASQNRDILTARLGAARWLKANGN